MGRALKNCSVCEREFLVQNPDHIHREGGEITYFCSSECRSKHRTKRGMATCSVCDEEFTPKYAYQRGREEGQVVYFCSMECRRPVASRRRSRHQRQKKGAMSLAVLNQKGGTGKTTTSVSLAAGLAEDGHNVLLVDLDSQGHIGVSLGVDGDGALSDLLMGNRSLEQAVVGARPNLDILMAGDELSEAEIELARMKGRHGRVLEERLETAHDYDFVLLDCSPSLSLVNKNALTYADHLLVPVACDFLSLVGVKQVMRSLKKVNKELMNPVDILGILPTFYDMRNNISDEAIKTLKGHFHDKVLPPIRVNTRLKEAPSENETIFEYAPSSRGAKDYRKVVDWLVEEQKDWLKAS